MLEKTSIDPELGVVIKCWIFISTRENIYALLTSKDLAYDDDTGFCIASNVTFRFISI